MSAVRTPALYRTTIGHARLRPWRRAFRYHHDMWLLDLADLPRRGLLGRVLRFEARDHLGDPVKSIRENVVDRVAVAGLDVSGDRIVMLTNARSFGYVFNPLTIYWCLPPGDAVRCVVAEVHNTYGGRHSYVLVPDDEGRARVDKAFYVSPFNTVDGEYDMRFSLPGPEVAVGINWRRDGQIAFSATLRGRREPATTRAVAKSLARCPVAALRVSALIRYQGIRLFLRGLPVVPRQARTQEARHDGVVNPSADRSARRAGARALAVSAETGPKAGACSRGESDLHARDLPAPGARRAS